jgi:hypothetical protein
LDKGLARPAGLRGSISGWVPHRSCRRMDYRYCR